MHHRHHAQIHTHNDSVDSPEQGAKGYQITLQAQDRVNHHVTQPEEDDHHGVNPAPTILAGISHWTRASHKFPPCDCLLMGISQALFTPSAWSLPSRQNRFTLLLLRTRPSGLPCQSPLRLHSAHGTNYPGNSVIDTQAGLFPNG
jgi:hypothetical protein